MGVIEVDGLTKHYGPTVANDGLSFSIEAGEIFGYLGPNGAGKSTTIKQLMGFQSPTAGTARILGADVRHESSLLEVKGNIGFLPGDLAFEEDVTGREVLDLHARLKGDSRRDELLRIFQPPLDRKIREYSSGNRQMLGIIQAFMHDPAVLIMDEPTAGLDPLKQEAFNDFLRSEREAGKTIFFSSHILGEVRRVCDRVGIIRDGRLLTVETVESFINRGGKRVRLQTPASLSADDIALEGIHDFEAVGEEVHFTFVGEYNALLEELSTIDIVNLEIDEPPVEDLFMHFYGEGPSNA